MLTILLALFPILLILVLMVGFRWGAARAGASGYLAALLIAWLFFGATPELLVYAHGKAFFLALDVLLIIWAAFLLYRVVDEAGAIRTIGLALPHLTADRGMQALIIGWVFATFLQGVGGFGVPVAVIAPILVGLGFTPLSAVVIPSIGHGWAVTFGSMGSSFQALLAATNQPEKLLAPPAAIFLGISGFLVGFMVAHAAGGWPAVRRLVLPVLILGAVMGSIQYLVAVNGPWNIAAFIAGLFGLIVGFPLAYRNKKKNPAQNEKLEWRALGIALSGYAVLILITLSVQMVPAIHQLFGKINIQAQFPEVESLLGYSTPASSSRRLVIFRHTGMILFYSATLAYLVYQKAGLYKPGSLGRILDGTLRKVMSSSVSIFSMISMAVVMEHVGMTERLALGLAQGVGNFFPLASPWIGALGAFMTGSNTNSNVVFGGLQMRTAEILGYSIPIILAAQTAGAALASVLAPTKVVVGASTAGMAGREGEVMRHLVIYTSSLVLLISIVAMLFIWL